MGEEGGEGGPGPPARTLRVKLVLLGSSGVGKSCLALRLSKNTFKNTTPTVGCAYLTQVVCVCGVTVRFEIWDTAGQEKYHSVTPLYYRGAHAAMLVYDISSRETFSRAQLWLKELENQNVAGSAAVWLVGNKADLEENRQVSAQEGRSLASDRGLAFTETSALSGDGVRELLLAVAHRVQRTVVEQQDWQERPHAELRHRDLRHRDLHHRDLHHRDLHHRDLHHRDTSNAFGSCCKVGP